VSDIIRVLVTVVGLGSMFLGVYKCNDLFLTLVMEVNSRLSVDARFTLMGWGPDKMWHAIQEYRRLYPTGVQLRRLRRWSLVAVSGGVFVGAVSGMPIIGVMWLGMVCSALCWFLFR